MSSEGNPFFDDVISGFRKAEEELSDYGVTVLLKTMRGYDVDHQLGLIDELTDAGMAVLVIQPVNDERIETPYPSARRTRRADRYGQYGYRKQLPRLLCGQ